MISAAVGNAERKASWKNNCSLWDEFQDCTMKKAWKVYWFNKPSLIDCLHYRADTIGAVYEPLSCRRTCKPLILMTWKRSAQFVAHTELLTATKVNDIIHFTMTAGSVYLGLLVKSSENPGQSLQFIQISAGLPELSNSLVSMIPKTGRATALWCVIRVPRIMFSIIFLDAALLCERQFWT